MKKNYFLSLMAALPMMIFAQEVPELQTPLVVKKTATWCGPCGTWGWNLYSELYNERDASSVMVEMHQSSSSALYSSASAGLYAFHEPRSSTPVFYVNTVNEVEYASSGGIFTAQTKVNMLNAIDQTLSESPVVNAGISYSVNNNVLEIDTKVKFFQNATGEYYLGVYLAENNVEAQQAGISGIATHKRVIRASAYSNAQGELIIDGSAAAGDEFTSSHSINVNSNWNVSNFYVFTVIWKKENNEFIYVNASKQMGGLNTNENLAKDFSLKMYPNAISAGQPFNIQFSDAINEDVKLTVFDQVGKMVKHINIPVHEHQYDNLIHVNDTHDLNSGLYFVTVSSANGGVNLSKKLIVK